jgi:hypothetical protein
MPPLEDVDALFFTVQFEVSGGVVLGIIGRANSSSSIK